MIQGKPIVINSGCRCEAHNKAVKGSPNSQHLLGNAVDIRIPEGYAIEWLASLASNIPAFGRTGGIGQYPKKGFLHLDVRGNGPSKWTL